MQHLNNHRLPTKTNPKLQHRKYGPFPILKKINYNSYIISLPSEWHISFTFNVSDISSFHPPEGSVVSVENFGKNSCEDTDSGTGA